MRRYDSTRMIRAVLTLEQKTWLQSQAKGMDTMSDVLRRLIDEAMARGAA